MAIDNVKVDEMTLALLYLTRFEDKHGAGVVHHNLLAMDCQETPVGSIASTFQRRK